MDNFSEEYFFGECGHLLTGGRQPPPQPTLPNRPSGSPADSTCSGMEEE